MLEKWVNKLLVFPSLEHVTDSVALQGFNWFGFETGDTVFQGLTPNYATPRNISQTGDFATVAYRQQALGYNTIRMPFR